MAIVIVFFLVSVHCDRFLDSLLDLFSHEVGLSLVGLEQEADPVGVVVHGEVSQPGASVGVYNNLVSSLNLSQNRKLSTM